MTVPSTKIILSAFCLSAFALPVFAAEPATKLSDAEIIKIVETANDAEIRASEVAKGKAKDDSVKNFAKDMIKVHEDNNKEGKQLAKTQKISPKESDTSRSLKKETDEKITDLKRTTGKEFEKAYINAQIDMHKKVLASIDNELLPNAQNPELKAMLEKTRPVVEEHLTHAQHLQESMMQ